MEKAKRKGQSRREFIAGSAVLGSVLAPGIASGATLDLPPPPAGVRKLRITKVEATYLVKPLKERFWMSLAPIGGYEPKATRLILYVHTDQGIVGVAEGSGGAAGVLRKGFADLIVGEDPQEVERLWQKMFDVTVSRQAAIRGWEHDGVLAAIAVLDAALWDIMARTAGLPLYKFLGGANKGIDCYVTGCYYREGTGEKELVEEVEMYVKMGYRALKIKTGGVPVDEDVRRARLVRKTVGKDFRFVQGLVRLKKDCPIPLASGENELTRYGARRLLETGAIDFMQFDCQKTCGPTEWLKVASMAAASDVWMAPHHEPQLHGHLMAAIPNAYILESFGHRERDPFWFELYTRKPEIRESKLWLLEEPGIGVEFDKSVIQKYGSKIL